MLMPLTAAWPLRSEGIGAGVGGSVSQRSAAPAGSATRTNSSASRRRMRASLNRANSRVGEPPEQRGGAVTHHHAHPSRTTLADGCEFAAIRAVGYAAPAARAPLTHPTGGINHRRFRSECQKRSSLTEAHAYI